MYNNVLNNDQISRIHRASLDVLERVGVVVPHQEMLARFADSGAKVDFKNERVWITGELVKKSLEIAEKKFILYGRDLSKTAKFGYGTRNYNSSAGQASWVEEVGSQRRYATLDDVAIATRMGDGLQEINVVGAMSDPYEIDVRWRCVEVLASMIKNTSKPVTFWLHDRASAKYLVDMSVALRGNDKKALEYPLFYPFFEPISPLRFPFNGIDLLFETSRINLPVPVGPMAQMGLSAPGTIAATLAQQNAEILAGICITQLIKPGLPVCYGGTCHAFDMASTQLIFGGPEQAILSVAMTQMGKYYGLPVYINVGLTDSKCIDAQAGLESGITLAQGAAAGADIFGHMGICGVDQAGSLDFLVFQNEVIAYVNRMVKEIEISVETLGLDEMIEVGSGGTYLDRIFTAEHYRSELWFPKLLDRNFYQSWMDGGRSSMADRCRMKREEMLKSHNVEPVSETLEKLLDEIVAAAKKDLG